MKTGVACLKKSVFVVSFIALCLLLLAMRLVNDVTFPLLLNCFGQPENRWIPLSYTFRQPLRTHYGYINVRTQESHGKLNRMRWCPPTSFPSSSNQYKLKFLLLSEKNS
nr:alpha-N-acetylgalactosaminide alpha-2,6-sialyltransferase 3 isoform X2 [Meriones unguiculatus]